MQIFLNSVLFYRRNMLIFYDVDFEGHLLTLCCPPMLQVRALSPAQFFARRRGNIWRPRAMQGCQLVSLAARDHSVAILLCHRSYVLKRCGPCRCFAPEITQSGVRQHREERASYAQVHRKYKQPPIWCLYCLCHFILSRNLICSFASLSRIKGTIKQDLLLPVFLMQIASI
jgi:hypothetical protein